MRVVPEEIFERHGDLFLPTEATIGPWSREAQRGGPPTMLMARAVERVEAARPMRVVRLAVELLRPVPVTFSPASTRTAEPGLARLSHPPPGFRPAASIRHRRDRRSQGPSSGPR